MKLLQTKRKLLQTQQRDVQMFRYGGIIAGGVGHDEKNDLGDRGIPVVDYTEFEKGGRYSKDIKHAEVESKELVFNKETADKINSLVKAYDGCLCPGKLVELGRVVKEALKITTDETCRTGCEFTPQMNKIKQW